MLRKYAFGPLAELVEKRRTIVRENLEASERCARRGAAPARRVQAAARAGAPRGGRDRRARAPHRRRARAPDARGGHGPARARRRRRQGRDRRRDAAVDRPDQDAGRRPDAASRPRRSSAARSTRPRAGASSKRRSPRSTSRSSGRSSAWRTQPEDASTARRWPRPRQAAGRLREVARDLAAIGAAVAEGRDLAGALFNPAFPDAAKKQILAQMTRGRRPARAQRAASCSSTTGASTRCPTSSRSCTRPTSAAAPAARARAHDRRPDRRRRGRVDPRQAGRRPAATRCTLERSVDASILGGVVVRVRDRWSTCPCAAASTPCACRYAMPAWAPPEERVEAPAERDRLDPARADREVRGTDRRRRGRHHHPALATASRASTGSRAASRSR